MTEATGSVRLWIQDPATGVSCPPHVLVTAWLSTVLGMPGLRPQLPNGERHHEKSIVLPLTT